MTLHVVATPLGNLGDLSDRARRVLTEVDVVYAEDTRHSGPLLRSFGVQAPLRSCHDFSESARVAGVLEELRAGLRLALISDAGTPCISDPGYRLVRAAREAGLPVSPVPGPSAVTAFLSAAGLPTDAFTFGGFVPRREEARRSWLARSLEGPHTWVCYESPKRVVETLKVVAELAPEREVCVAREMTKLHEEFLFGTAEGVSATLGSRASVRGEFVLGWSGAPEPEADLAEADAWLVALLDAGMRTRDAARVVSTRMGLRTKELYTRALTLMGETSAPEEPPEVG